MWGKIILTFLMHFWNHHSIHCYGIFTQVKTSAWINKNKGIKAVCHSQTKDGPAKGHLVEGRWNFLMSWVPGKAVGWVFLFFSFFPSSLSSLTRLYFPLLSTSCPLFSIFFPCFSFLLPFLSCFSLVSPASFALHSLSFFLTLPLALSLAPSCNGSENLSFF